MDGSQNDDRRSRKRVRRLKRRMPGPRLLDVGSNIGCLVEAGREIGLDAVGVEINPVLVEAARETYPEATFIASAMEESDCRGDEEKGGRGAGAVSPIVTH